MDKIIELKARVYDLISQREQIEIAIRQTNEEIVKLYNAPQEIKEKAKEDK